MTPVRKVRHALLALPDLRGLLADAEQVEQDEHRGSEASESMRTSWELVPAGESSVLTPVQLAVCSTFELDRRAPGVIGKFPDLVMSHPEGTGAREGRRPVPRCDACELPASHLLPVVDVPVGVADRKPWPRRHHCHFHMVEVLRSIIASQNNPMGLSIVTFVMSEDLRSLKIAEGEFLKSSLEPLEKLYQLREDAKGVWDSRELIYMYDSGP